MVDDIGAMQQEMANRQKHKLSSSEKNKASIAQLGERKTEDLKAPCSIHGRSIFLPISVDCTSCRWCMKETGVLT